MPERVTFQGARSHLRATLDLVRPVQPVAAARPQAIQSREPDGPAPVWLIVDRAAHYAARSGNRGAFIFGLFMHDQDSQKDSEALLPS